MAFFGLTDLCLLAFVAFDTIKHKRVHPVFLWGVPLLILFQPFRLFMAGTSVWMSIATALVKLVS
ncbi:MAG: hypothetical protein DMF69_09105 [Acidobacteria bacterium]|nr:MAG: hypothetical protein DMF69_09105 [Acidobacteriota bacterium]